MVAQSGLWVLHVKVTLTDLPAGGKSDSEFVNLTLSFAVPRWDLRMSQNNRVQLSS